MAAQEFRRGIRASALPGTFNSRLAWDKAMPERASTCPSPRHKIHPDWPFYVPGTQ
jgi:hypothetical protein